MGDITRLLTEMAGDPSGNSRAGRVALHELAERLELSLLLKRAARRLR